MELLQTLQSFGLTQYEAKAFMALVSTGSASAYQISKVSGIPRARIYDILESLIDRGLVMAEETNNGGKTYQPLPVDAFLEQQKRIWTSSFEAASLGLKQLESRQPQRENHLSTIKGTEGILSFCRTLIQGASNQILLSMWSPMYDELLPYLQERVDKGCRIRGIVFEVDEPLDGLYCHRRNEYMASLARDKWFILSVDSQELLYGHSAEQSKNAFYTDDPVHLFLLEDYIWHDVLVNRLVEKGEQKQLDDWILPEMEHFFGQKMLPDSFWKHKDKAQEASKKESGHDGINKG
jgi:HTH-type transcriptional regulator, sugar sensing transcriptional regulator